MFSSYATGKELYDAYKAGKNPTVRLETSGETIAHFYPQVVAETQARRSAAHGARRRAPRLGPGRAGHQRRRLGHGVAARARRADREAEFAPRNKVRFLWFGGEEDGLVGSQYYAEHLSQAEVDKVDVMIDTDMIASPNYARLDLRR